MNSRTNFQEAFKFALSMALVYWLSLSMDWYLARYGALAVVVISLSTSGASITKGVMRVIGTIIACIVAFIMIDWFSQSRWSMMFGFAIYLTFIAYFLQTSRYPYAWYVAGYVPLVILSDTYGEIDNTFHFAVFRLMETASGVIIYSMVSVLLWPKTASELFYRQGEEYLVKLCQLIRFNRDNLNGIKRNTAPAVQRKLEVLSTRLQVTLENALVDTMVVYEYKNDWEHALATLRALTDSLALWQSINEMYLRLYPDHGQSDLEYALEIIEARCARIGELWQTRQIPGEAPAGDDALLLQTLSFNLSLPGTIPIVERGLLMNRIDQLQQLDKHSQNLLLLLRRLNELDSTVALIRVPECFSPDQPPRWDPVRLYRALIPSCAFIIGFLFWIYPLSPPPAGMTSAVICGVFGLLVCKGVNGRLVGFVAATAGLLVIAPIYFVVMPWLNGGGFLTMVFLLSFTASYLGGRWPVVKAGVMVAFVLSVNISNVQVYSFMGWVGFEFSMIMAGIIINVVMMFITPVHPEKILLYRINRFFHACSVITGGLATVEIPRARANKKRDQLLREVRMIPFELRTIEKTLNYRLFSENTQCKVHCLIDSVQSIAVRMRVLEELMERVAKNASITPLGTELPDLLQKLFERWTKATAVAGVSEEERGAIQVLYHALEQRLEEYHAEAGTLSYNERLAMDLTALLGGVRGLLDAMMDMDQSIGGIHWQHWAEAHF